MCATTPSLVSPRSSPQGFNAFFFFSCYVSRISFYALQWGTTDAKMKVPSTSYTEKPQLSKPCFACCQEFCLPNFWLPISCNCLSSNSKPKFTPQNTIIPFEQLIMMYAAAWVCKPQLLSFYLHTAGTHAV